MMDYRKLLCLALVVFGMVAGGCGLKEGVVQKDSKSFVRFTGNTQNAVVYIDDLTPIELDRSDSGDHEVRYEISPGKHTIIVKKSGEEVVNRNILLGGGMGKEINIP